MINGVIEIAKYEAYLIQLRLSSSIWYMSAYSIVWFVIIDSNILPF